MSGQEGERSALEDVKAELVAREPIFHKPELGTTREAYLAQTAEDYWEVGASGQIYDRDFVVEELVQRGKLTLWRRDPDGWKILYHQGTIIGEP